MPFDQTHKVVYGTDARRVPTWGCSVLIAYLSGKLNDPLGPYFTPLGLDAMPDDLGEPTRMAVVSGVARIAEAVYSSEAKDPTVFVGKGPKPNWQTSGANIGGTFYQGKRTELVFNLDSGVNTAPNDFTTQEDADSELADFIVDALERGYDELAALGLNNLSVEADEEAQRAGEGRNPIRVTCFVVSLDEWMP